ncbi:hypothetical protein GA0111570_103126 [Raineyella antarctica]|uniref:Uncharacterized protein n=1 Tax=Raineyella antarctica TaxID=1577474 RepID=A0A1G6GG54_9ACTN|nr:hypothetical protein [Raineyella antarctica]SDB80803.1 hypothetical protein GA0111570_103126 [Raineyella antarctica]
MHTIYKYIAHLIALLVVVQAAVVVWGMAAEIKYQLNNPTATLDSVPFPAGAMVHGMVGMYVIPIVALVLVALSLAMRDGRKWALLILLAAILQVALGIGGVALSEYLGLLHGINAFVLLGLAEYAAWRGGSHQPLHADAPRAAASVS